MSIQIYLLTLGSLNEHLDSFINIEVFEYSDWFVNTEVLPFGGFVASLAVQSDACVLWLVFYYYLISPLLWFGILSYRTGALLKY